jgi:phage shock protein PspC (stress-responsive transcriptional regulator)
MKKTLSIHLGRQLFVIEEDAFDRLQQYLKRLETSLQGENGTAEIIEDIEMRFAELLMSYLGETRRVVTIADVEKGIASLGEPEVISEDTVRDESQSRSSSQQNSGQRRFYRDPEGGILGGVCAGLAAYLNIDPVIVRIGFILLAFAGFMVPLYIILWVIVPSASTPSERLQMQGKQVTVDALKDEIGRAADRIKDDTLRARDRFKANNEHILRRGHVLAKVLLKIVGIVLIGFASLGLIFFTLTVTGLIDFIPMTGDEEYASVHDFLQIAVSDNRTFDLMWTGILLAGSAAPLLGIAIGTRLLMDRKSPRPLRIALITLPVVIVIGIICGAVSGAQIGRDFAVYESFEQQQLTSNTHHLVVSELPHYYAGRRIVSSGGVDFVNVKNGMVTEQGIIISYRPSRDSLFHVHHYISANGVDSEAALKRSGNIRHDVRLQGDTLVVDPYYSYPVADGFRAQRIKVIIDVPKGKKLTIKNWEVFEPESEYSGRFLAGEPFGIWRNDFDFGIDHNYHHREDHWENDSHH